MYLKFNSVSLVFFIFMLCVSINPLIVSCDNLTLQNEETTEAVFDIDCSNRLNFYHYCSNDNKCISNIQLPNGNISVTDTSNIKTLHFTCQPGYHLIGPPKIICEEWDDIYEKPSCIKGCVEPPMVLNGEVLINGDKDGAKLFSDGVVAEYACAAGYRLVPITSQHRVCRQGEWTGSPVTCVFEGCPRFKGILNGRIILEREDSIEKILEKEVTQDIIMENSDFVKEGVIMHYKCDSGYNLIGPSYVKCQPTGTWQPHKLPLCKKSKFNSNRTISPPMDYYPPLKTSSTRDYFENVGTPVNGVGASCVTPHLGPHVQILAIQPNSGSSTSEIANTVPDGTVIEVTCSFSYRDKHSPCVRQLLHCDKGSWKGHFPSCVKAENCFFPAKIPHGELESVTGGVGGGLFDIGGQVTYSCLPGYQLTGEPMLTCQTGGCWEPNMIPICEPQFYLSTSWPEYWNTNTSLLFSGVTALSVLFVLLSVCLAVIFRHRPTPLHHHHPSAPPPPPTLVPPPPDPDRVALIAFADGIQSGLPSYEEAIRGANSGGRGLLSSYRLHHPPWSQRRNPRPDNTIITRQLSSTGESMGSTDTMTVSDVSTNVTLDTVSSHTCSSTSQSASCRAICGSLASFDTSSVLNTEGVPLLEENELEESGANSDLDDNSIPPACDNTSFKLHSDIDSIHS